MNRVLVVLGVVLLSLGLLSLKYSNYSWTEETTATISTPVVDIELPAKRTHTVAIPTSVSWGAAVVGWLLVAAGVLTREAPGPPPTRPAPRPTEEP